MDEEHVLELLRAPELVLVLVFDDCEERKRVAIGSHNKTGEDSAAAAAGTLPGHP